MAHCLTIIDESHMPAHLETPNPRTISFYGRHGFEVIGEAQAGACPAITLMSRAAHESSSCTARPLSARCADRRTKPGQHPIGPRTPELLDRHRRS